MKKIYLSLVLCFFMIYSWSQEFKRMISAGTYTVQEIQAEAEAYFAIVGTERGKGYNPYKRWEYQAFRNMDENGMLKSPDFYFNELQNYNNYINQNETAFRTTVGTWEELGPTYWNATSGYNPGVGRITSMAFENGNTNHIIIGANTGGVWKTMDAGANWTVLTDNLSNLEVYALAIDPTNASTYFWGTTSGSIFKSTDAGSTWNFLADTGDGLVNKILIDPTNTSKMYCAVEGGGIFKTSNGGISWAIIHASATNGYDIEFKPGDTNTIYASGNEFFVSRDGGTTFQRTPALSGGPKMMGVSSNNPSVLYVLSALFSGTFHGLYKSIDSGVTFTFDGHAGKNYFGYESDGSDALGQAPRDMDITVNPADVNDVHIAGINTWRSTNGGTTFTITSQWTPGGAAFENIGYCHADVDMLEYIGTKLYAATDGGIFVANTPTTVNSNYYSDLSFGLGIKQFYKIGVSQTNPAIVSGGSQDNGTSLMDINGDWTDWYGADGMETFVDKTNSNIIYGTAQFGWLVKSLDSGLNIITYGNPLGFGNWITPFEQDPITQNVVYTGYNFVYKSTNGGDSWTPISQNFGSSLDHLKIAPTNNNIMYAALGNSLFKTVDGGATNWTQLNGFVGSINSIAIHPTDPNKIAIATTGAQKVYVSSNGGSTWTPYLFNLPNFSALALVWQNNGIDGLYLGMNYGVYYIDNTLSNNWQPFNNNLPNVIVSELEINAATNKIYAATYGRGLWTSDLFDANLSVEDFDLNGITLFPNPAKGELNLSLSNNQDVSIRIFNALGKLMYYSKNQNINSTFKIDISQYASGMYFVKINNDKGEVTKKLIVE